jgi:hypothetical protein
METIYKITSEGCLVRQTLSDESIVLQSDRVTQLLVGRQPFKIQNAATLGGQAVHLVGEGNQVFAVTLLKSLPIRYPWLISGEQLKPDRKERVQMEVWLKKNPAPVQLQLVATQGLSWIAVLARTVKENAAIIGQEFFMFAFDSGNNQYRRMPIDNMRGDGACCVGNNVVPATESYVSALEKYIEIIGNNVGCTDYANEAAARLAFDKVGATWQHKPFTPTEIEQWEAISNPPVKAAIAAYSRR